MDEDEGRGCVSHVDQAGQGAPAPADAGIADKDRRPDGSKPTGQAGTGQSGERPEPATAGAGK